MLTAEQLIAALQLVPQPQEGGYFRETHRSPLRLAAGAVPGYRTDKAVSTAIYYLLTPDTFSALHRLPADEVFHFYVGDPVQQLQLFPDGSGRVVVLGPDVLAGQSPQLVVPAGVWQGSCLAPGGSFALMGTTMAPGFDFDDYEGGDRVRLVGQYPGFADPIGRLTRTT